MDKTAYYDKMDANKQSNEQTNQPTNEELKRDPTPALQRNFTQQQTTAA